MTSDSIESSYYLGEWTLRFLLLFSKAKKVSKNAFLIYPRHFPSFRFATNGTTDKAHDLIRTNMSLTSQLCFKETLCFFSLVALQHGSAKKLLFEPSYFLGRWTLRNFKSPVSVPGGRIVFGIGFRSSASRLIYKISVMRSIFKNHFSSVSTYLVRNCGSRQHPHYSPF